MKLFVDLFICFMLVMLLGAIVGVEFYLGVKKIRRDNRE